MIQSIARREALQFADESVARMARVLDGVEQWVERRESDVLVNVLRELHTMRNNAHALRLEEVSSRARALECAIQQLVLPVADARATGEDELVDLLSELRPALLDLQDRLARHDSPSGDPLPVELTIPAGSP